jgi:hypothetical protein
MYPGSSGSSYNVNKNSPGNGNGKWQGLPGLTNMRSSLVIPTKKRAYGNNRNQVFCMNQLGGIGRRSNMFASNADGVKQPYQGSGGNIPTNNLGLQFIPGDGTVEIPITTLSTNNQLWISNFDTATPSSRQSQVFDIYNTLADNRIYLDYIANQADDVAGGGLLIFPIGQTSMNDTTLQSNFTNVWLLTSEVNLSRMVSLVFFGSKIRPMLMVGYDQNGFSNGEADANLGVPSSVPTSGSGVGLLIEHTVERAGIGSYVLRPGSTITLPTL